MASRAHRPAKRASGPQSSERFSIPDLDTAAFLSSDKVIFHVDRSRLARDAHGFPPQELAPPPQSETIPLSEDAVTLELLFRIIYREERVRLDSLPFENIAALAEAAEKYDVYAAILLCRIAMEAHCSDHTLAVMSYAARYGHNDILDNAAGFSVGLESARVRQELPLNHFAAWAVYVGQYSKLAKTMVIRKSFRVCDLCTQRIVRKALEYGPECLTNRDTLFSEDILYPKSKTVCEKYYGGGGECKMCLLNWKDALAAEVNQLQPLSSFL
ncbi:hypothetical protein K525DRAFT_290631 [Schizophyllum commune Loenen D]|nr:hypothetical protein K525DRAFT_290631 [Schizophyllum commune Loenen D]